MNQQNPGTNGDWPQYQPPMAQPQQPMPPRNPGHGPYKKPVSGLAVTGLVLGIIAIVISWVPIINNLAFVLAIIGLVFAIIGIVKTGSRSDRRGRGLGVAGVVLSVLAFIIVLATQSMYGKIIDEATQAVTDPSTSSQQAPPDSTGDDAQGQATEQPLVVTGGAWNGWDGYGFGTGTFTVRNDTDAPAKIVTTTVAFLDANGNIVGETYPQLGSDIQPGQSANVDWIVSQEGNAGVVSAQVTAISWATGDNGEGFQQISVLSDQVQIQ